MVAIREVIKVLAGNLPHVNNCVLQCHESIMWPSRPEKLIKHRTFQTFWPFCVQDYSFLIFFASTPFLIKKSLISLWNCYKKITCEVSNKRCLFKVASVKYELKIIQRSFSLWEVSHFLTLILQWQHYFVWRGCNYLIITVLDHYHKV